MVTLITDIGKLTLRPIVMDGAFQTYIEGVEIKNEDGVIAEICDYSIEEINEKSAVSLFIVYSVE